MEEYLIKEINLILEHLEEYETDSAINRLETLKNKIEDGSIYLDD